MFNDNSAKQIAGYSSIRTSWDGENNVGQGRGQWNWGYILQHHSLYHSIKMVGWKWENRQDPIWDGMSMVCVKVETHGTIKYSNISEIAWWLWSWILNPDLTWKIGAVYGNYAWSYNMHNQCHVSQHTCNQFDGHYELGTIKTFHR